MNKNLHEVFICPFCGGHFSALADNHIVHTAPPCEEFEKADDALVFVTKANDKIYGDTGDTAELERLRRDD